MATTYYSEEHEWITVDGNTGTVGITDFAQEQLGDIVFAEVTKANEEVTKDEEVLQEYHSGLPLSSHIH